VTKGVRVLCAFFCLPIGAYAVGPAGERGQIRVAVGGKRVSGPTTRRTGRYRGTATSLFSASGGFAVP